MFLRAPPDSQPFRGDALRTWALAHGVVGYNPNGTLTDRPGAGFNPQWMNTRPYNVPGFIPLWPSMPSMPTSFLPMHREAVPLWRSFYGMGALPTGIDVPAIISTAVPILEREVEAAATRAVKKVFRDYVMPPLAGVAALAGIALIVSISAYRKKNARKRNGRRRNAAYTPVKRLRTTRDVLRQMTREDVKALRDESGAAGDLEMVKVCDRALRGSKAALRECAFVILNAQEDY